MTTHRLWAFLGTAAVLLAACGRNDVPMPTTPAREIAIAPAPTSASTPSSDVSIPPASEALAGRPNGAADPASGARTSGALTKAQQATAMPMAGQNNDHSAPLAPARAASAR